MFGGFSFGLMLLFAPNATVRRVISSPLATRYPVRVVVIGSCAKARAAGPKIAKYRRTATGDKGGTGFGSSAAESGDEDGK